MSSIQKPVVVVKDGKEVQILMISGSHKHV